jgi:hypothetical protein
MMCHQNVTGAHVATVPVASMLAIFEFECEFNLRPRDCHVDVNGFMDLHHLGGIKPQISPC